MAKQYIVVEDNDMKPGKFYFIEWNKDNAPNLREVKPNIIIKNVELKKGVHKEIPNQYGEWALVLFKDTKTQYMIYPPYLWYQLHEDHIILLATQDLTIDICIKGHS